MDVKIVIIVTSRGIWDVEKNLGLVKIFRPGPVGPL